MAFLAFDDGLGGTTNLLKWSEAFDNAAWTKTTGVTVTANAATAPDGTTGADAVVYAGGGTSGSFRIFQGAQAPLATVASGQAFTLSVWLRTATSATVRLANNHGNFTICALTPTWQRFSVSGVGTGSASGQILIYSATGDNAAWTIHAWGAQAEVGVVATGYVATTSATATKASLRNDYPAPANRFSNWTPSTKPFGDSVNTLASGAVVMFRHRTDYGASFDLEGIPVKAQTDGVNYVAIADRLCAHLLSGGTVSVQTGDSSAMIYPTCGLAPGSSPSLRLTDRVNLLYSLSLSLINLAATPVRLDAVYAP